MCQEFILLFLVIIRSPLWYTSSYSFYNCKAKVQKGYLTCLGPLSGPKQAMKDLTFGKMYNVKWARARGSRFRLVLMKGTRNQTLATGVKGQFTAL